MGLESKKFVNTPVNLQKISLVVARSGPTQAKYRVPGNQSPPTESDNDPFMFSPPYREVDLRRGDSPVLLNLSPKKNSMHQQQQESSESKSLGANKYQEHSLVQLIDDNGKFRCVFWRHSPVRSSKIAHSDNFAAFLEHTKLIECKKYNILAVFGPQSSGKSTLLNQLFRTEFPVMDSGKGRRQTTKGVIVSKPASSDIVLMDLEGTDSKERGEENAVSAAIWNVLFSATVFASKSHLNEKSPCLPFQWQRCSW